LATDARADVTLLYGYATGAIAPFTFANQADHTLSPRSGFRSPPEAFDLKRVKLARGDFNGDGAADLAVLHGAKDGSLGLHTFLASPDGQYQAPLSSWKAPRSWGAWDRLKLTSGDYNGDGRVEAGIFRPNNPGGALWYAPLSGGGVFNIVLGAPGDVPVPADYDGDGRTDAAIYRSSIGLHFAALSGGGVRRLDGVGQAGDIPLGRRITQ